MIFDCFMFSDELNILELRLTETFEHIDYFVIVEATKTHTGAAKPLHFAENASRFQPFREKIIHVVVDDMPTHEDPWVLENHQRNGILRGLYPATDTDLVIIGDVDEIIRPQILQTARHLPHDLIGFQMMVSAFKYNYVCVQGEVMSVWSVGTRARHVRRLKPQYFRDSRLKLQNVHGAGALFEEFALVIPHAGWHFSWIGDGEKALKKLQNTPHQELNTPENVAGLKIEEIIHEGRDLFNRPDYRWAGALLNDYFPRTLLQDRERYAANILDEVSLALQVG